MNIFDTSGKILKLFKLSQTFLIIAGTSERDYSAKQEQQLVKQEND